jgi:uncharacterized protein YndB with AHSA1/START domain
VFEAVHSERTTAPPSAIWALWEDPERWPEWNAQIERVTLDGELALGGKARVKYRRGGRAEFEIVALEPGRLLVDEARFPGARFGHEHRIEENGDGCEITHRLYVTGPAAGFWALMLGRKRLRTSVTDFTAREREIVE